MALDEKKNIWQAFSKAVKANVLVGLILIMPLFVTVWVISFLFKYLTDSLLSKIFQSADYSVLHRLLALLVLFSGLFLIGLFARNLLGRRLYKIADRLMGRIPIVKTVYMSIRQVSESLVKSRKTLFKQVVAVQFPRHGLYSVGFLTGEVPPDAGKSFLKTTDGKPSSAICVFVPTAPNPTTGFFLIVPKDEVTFLDISVQDAMKMILSAGAVFPGDLAETDQSLIDTLHDWLDEDSKAKNKA